MTLFKNNFSFYIFTTIFLKIFPATSTEINYGLRHYKTVCSRFEAIAQLNLFPTTIVELIRQYEKIVFQSSTSTTEKEQLNNPITAFALLPRNRIVIATKEGLLSIINYRSGKTLLSWDSRQKNIDRIDTVTFSESLEDERIISRTPPIMGSNMKIWDGKGAMLSSSVNRYTCNYFQYAPLIFDAINISRPDSLGGINDSMLLKIGSPYSIERSKCKHMVFLTSASIIVGYRSGLLEHWLYKYRSPSIMWQQMPLNINNPDLKPITALCVVSEDHFIAGFFKEESGKSQKGIIEAWRYIEDKEVWEIRKTWKAHKELVKNIKIFNKDVCLTSAGNVLKMWQLPSYEKIGKREFHAPITSVLTTNSHYPPNDVIVCFEEEPLQVWSC